MTGTSTTHEARFNAAVQIESFTTNEISAPLFQGDVAVTARTLPAGVRLTRAGDQYYALGRRARRLRPEIGGCRPRSRAPSRGIKSASRGRRRPSPPFARRRPGTASRCNFLAGRRWTTTKRPSHVEGFLSAGREVSLRWQSKAAEVARNALIAVETTSSAQVTPAVIKLATTLHYELLQASVPRLRIALPAGQSLDQAARRANPRLESGSPTAGGRFCPSNSSSPLRRNTNWRFFRATHRSHARLQSKSPRRSRWTSSANRVPSLFPRADTVVDIAGATGLRRVNASGEALAAFQFSARPFLLTANVKRIEPVLTVADQVKRALEESRLLVNHVFRTDGGKGRDLRGGIDPADQLCRGRRARRRGGGLEGERGQIARRLCQPRAGNAQPGSAIGTGPEDFSRADHARADARRRSRA